MPRRRFRRKDLRRPDEFVSQGRRLLIWAGENTRALSWGVGALAAIALVISGVISIRNARVRQANEDLGRALAGFRPGNYPQAATQLGDVATRWPSTSAGRVAALYAANADLRAENFDAATTQLQTLAGSRDWPPYLHQEVLMGLAFASERKADLTNAAARYLEAAGLDGPYKAVAILGEGRCREQLGEKGKARELYERLSRDFPELAEAEGIAGRLQQLGTSSS